MAKPKIGLHVSGALGLEKAPLRARALGCECFQFFSRSPRGGGAPPISAATSLAFRTASARYGLRSFIHAPYYINFASSNHRISFGSVSAVREELFRGTILGARFVMTHLGSASDLGENAALAQAVERIHAVFDPKKLSSPTARLLLEISAGAGGIIGDTFEHLAYILKHVRRADIGVCLDTCHLLASGYDLRTPEAITATMKQFAKHIPLAKFQLLHANDSAFGLGAHKDRHADIGDGELGLETFRHLLAHRDFQGRDFILETPGEDARRKSDVALLKRLRDGRGGRERRRAGNSPKRVRARNR